MDSEASTVQLPNQAPPREKSSKRRLAFTLSLFAIGMQVL